ncbi:hypothetical protein SAMN05444372_103202 [Flavobacterium micromati]|uniref:Uncharacterized protein n=1 Tax=Flavobacterium micromati TaxID=229205 RepID=A0A1M5HZ22_9FLAO|nr:hypothetical protein [Flavobacterium micromati]SHG21284.1 hypothetical protein SAMN05444372_103202 [Flavobacterium micromati]
MNDQNFVSKFERIYENTNVALQNVDTAFENYNSIFSQVDYTVDKIGMIILQAKEIEKSIKIMDCQVEIMCKEFDMRIEKCKIQANLIQNVLPSFSNTTNSILNEILNMDSYSNDHNYIRHRSELIGTLRSTSDNITNMVITFMSI